MVNASGSQICGASQVALGVKNHLPRQEMQET